eukprot:NODE_375_length_8520_cov_0.377390.p5 type:complete len:216 gc:universal NODE_375_length_8520_cov_0.377390:710-1357(+)
MISIFDSNLLCHFENSQNCFEAVNQTVGAFQCGNACHKYASNYYLSSPSGVAVSFMSLGPDRWNLQQMIDCQPDGCLKSSWTQFSCILKNAGSLPNSDVATAIPALCKTCDPTDFISKCKKPYMLSYFNNMDLQCHKEDGSYCFVELYEKNSKLGLKNATCSKCSQYFYNDFVSVKGSGMDTDEFAQAGYNSTEMKKCSANIGKWAIVILLAYLW